MAKPTRFAPEKLLVKLAGRIGRLLCVFTGAGSNHFLQVIECAVDFKMLIFSLRVLYILRYFFVIIPEIVNDVRLKLLSV